MKDALFVFNLRDNLFSVRKLTNAGIEVLFEKSKAFIIKNGALIAAAY